MRYFFSRNDYPVIKSRCSRKIQVYTSLKHKRITASIFGRIWYNFPSRAPRAGLSALLHKAKTISLKSRVLRPLARRTEKPLGSNRLVARGAYLQPGNDAHSCARVPLRGASAASGRKGAFRGVKNEEAWVNG
jgi:hypothetical protein